MFSVHPDRKNIGEERHYAKGWLHYPELDDVETIGKAASKCAVAPQHWDCGWRGKIRFLGANWIPLDFDRGMTLDEVCEAFADATHVIGTTRSHQIAKGDEAARDRCRVFLKLPITITVCGEYEAVVRHYVETYGADVQAIDGAHKFWPCRDIISVRKGKEVPVLKKYKTVYANRVASTPQQGVPRWVSQLLNFGVGYGVSRNTTCYKIAVHLKKAGMSEREVVFLLMNSAIPIGPQVIGEVERAVRSGFL